MKKILFIVLPRYYDEKIRSKRMSATVVPYGALSLASYINRYSNVESDVKILDFNAIDFTEESMLQIVEGHLLKFEPDIIGISVIFNEAFYYIKHVSEKVKTVNPNTLIVVGGAVGTNLYDEVFEYTEAVDAISYSEGELAWKELAESTDMMRTIEANISLLSREKWSQGEKPAAQMVSDIDTLPFIDFSLVDISNYGVRSGLRNENYIGLPIHTTRGCPFNCIFCAAASVHGKKLRKMSAGRVLEELKDMKEKYNINHVQIDDDQFLLDMDRAKLILRGLGDLGLIPEFDSGFSARYLDEEIVRLLKDVHVDHVTLAIESGSERMLKEVIDKPLTNEEACRAVQTVRANGLYPRAFFVVGIPGETEEERLMTLKLARDMELDWAWFSIAAPFKGSRLYKECVEKGYIDTETANHTVGVTLKSSVINTDEFSADHISEQAYLFNLDINFLNHASLRQGDYKRAVDLFEDFVKKMPSHAFAWYALSVAYRHFGEMNKSEAALEKFREIVSEDQEWQAYAEYFHISG